MPTIRLKRAYESFEKSDGMRVLVDRLWPRGVSKERLHVDLWAKDIAPSTVLRQWFGHAVNRWPEFRRRYQQELRRSDARQQIARLLGAAKGGRVITLVYGARDELHNQAVVLRDLMQRRLSR